MDSNNTIVIGYFKFHNIKIVINKLTGREELSGFYGRNGYIANQNVNLYEWYSFRGRFK